jgi:hypothetical protein
LLWDAVRVYDPDALRQNVTLTGVAAPSVQKYF